MRVSGTPQAPLDSAVTYIRDVRHVHEVSEMQPTYRHATTPVPGKAMRDLLVDHDGRKQITNALMTRGFVCAEPIDIRDRREYWTLATNHDRETMRSKLAEVAEEKHAEISISGITNSSWQSGANALPTGRLTQRQLEVVRLAQERGYYEYPKETSASALAAELGVATSTLHEHLHKAEATLLGHHTGL